MSSAGLTSRPTPTTESRPESAASILNSTRGPPSGPATPQPPTTTAPNPADTPEQQARALTLALSSLDTPSPSHVLARMRMQLGSPRMPSTPTPRKYNTDDRFIPSSANIQSFRMGSPASLLSPEERLLRRHSDRSTSRDRSESPDRPVPGNMTFGVTPVAHAVTGTRPGQANRRISAGAVGVFGIGVGAQDASPPVQRGREVNGHIFQNKESPEVEMERHELWLSAALGVDRTKKVLNFSRPEQKTPVGRGQGVKTPGTPGSDPGTLLWDAVARKNNVEGSSQPPGKKYQKRVVPSTPFRVLDAPGLRDDYYCSLIAYSPVTHSLAVGLHSDVYSWNETGGAQPFEPWSSSHVTSLAFSSAEGENNILAIGRIDGSLSLWNPAESNPRIDQAHAAGIACISWKPRTTEKHIDSKKGIHTPWFSEEILVGDEAGNVHLYSVEWNTNVVGNPGALTHNAKITLLRKISVHIQQICGLAWSFDGEQFATGGNDNVAHLFDTKDVINLPNGNNDNKHLQGGERYRWPHGAAVKAMAFCPWQRSLLATGGGSNDRCIHFFHTFSGAPLATINVSAQVTSLLWSNSHREIAATFGYANPDHPVRIAVFSWPECRQVVAVPWQEDMRALYAISYPGGPAVSEGSLGHAQGDDEEQDEVEELLNAADAGRTRGHVKPKKKRDTEGCIVVAASDETVRFHEVWSETRRGVLGWRGILGGSDILEGLEGIDSDGKELIR